MDSSSPIKIFIADHLHPMAGESISPGALAVQGGQILGVGDPETLQAKFPGAERTSFSGKTILPGLVDANTDLSLSLFNETGGVPFRGEDGQLHLMPWLVNLSRFKAGLAIPQQQRAIKIGLEKLKPEGVTTVGDVCRFPAAIPLYEASNLRVVCLAEIENIQRKNAQEEFEQALALVDEVQNGNHSLLTAGLAPFSAYTLSKNLLKIIADHALTLGIPLHLKASLSFSEMEFFYDSLGEISAVLFKEAGWSDKIPPPHRMTPIQYLHEIGFLKAKPTLVGCVHLGPTDMALLERNRCRPLLSPQAFSYLQVGEIPFKKFKKSKIPWTLGTLGKAWGGSGSLWKEMRGVLYEAEESERDALAKDLLGAVTLGGAQVLGLEDKIGSLEAGKQADFIVVATPEGDTSLAAGLIDQTQAASLHASYVEGIRLFQA